jgi:hypothetical protein
MNAKIVGNKLVIEIPLNSVPVPSATGKTLVVASTHGNKVTAAKVDGKRWLQQRPRSSTRPIGPTNLSSRILL